MIIDLYVKSFGKSFKKNETRELNAFIIIMSYLLSHVQGQIYKMYVLIRSI